VSGIPDPKPLSAAEFKRMLQEHAGMPQCQKCMQPQRCQIGRLLDTIGAALEAKRRSG
jgi:hypothetical protein